MKAISPVRSARNNAQRPCEHALGITRSKSPLEDPLSLLYDMNDCYSMLKEMVPSLPQNKSVSKMEILQHVIDYILDLQNALDTGSPRGSPCQHHQLRHQQPGETGSPLTAVTSDISMLNFQSSDLPKGADATDSGTLFR